MICSNANNPSAQYEFGGHIDGMTGVVSGQLTYWAADGQSFAGQCGSLTSCNATGSDSFAITLARQP